MPQQPSRGGEDDGAQDETKIYHTEGEQEEKTIENVPGTRDSFDHLNDIKSSLVNEGESVSSQNKPGSNSQRNNNKRSHGSSSDYGDPSKDSRAKKVHGGVCEGNKSDQIPPRFPPSSYTNLAIIAGGYHNGSIIPGPPGSKMGPVVHPAGAYPPSLAHLMMYNQEHYPPGTPPPPHLGGPLEVDSKTGIPRAPRHPDMPLYHPLSPGTPLGQVPHHLEVYNMPWQGQPFYPLASAALRSPYPIVSGSNMHLSRPGMPPHPHLGMGVTGIPHPAIVTPGARQQDTQQQSNDRKQQKMTKEERKKKEAHIKKPLNAFMLYMKEMRASVVKECTLKESAAINQILGRRWHALSREEQAKYYELARKERQLHMQLYPGWSARDNYAVHGKKKKKKKDKTLGDNSEPSTPKKCRARFGVDQQEYWCKPCRRKKKCIRYVATDENGDKADDSGPEDMEQSPGSPDMGMGSPPSPRPSTSRSPVNSIHNSHPADGHSSHSVGSPPSSSKPTGASSSAAGAPSSTSSSSTHPAERSSHSTLSLHHATPSLSRPPSILSQPSSPFAQTSPAIVHIPHTSTHSGYPPSQGPVLVYPSSPLSMYPHLGSPEAFRSHHHLANGMLHHHGLISSVPPPPRPPMRRNGSTDVAQDLSMKSATVSA